MKITEKLRGLILAIALGSAGCSSAATSVPDPNAVKPDYFGMHIFYAHIDTKWPAVPFGSWRLWDAQETIWARIEPARGRWDFRAFDKLVSLAETNKVSVLYTLGQTPRWASARPNELASRGAGAAAEPINMNDWANYVRTVATRYKGRIKAYEIWNEPRFSDLYPWRNAGFYSGSAKKMVELSRVAYQVIKSIDPDAIVISPGMDGDSHALRKFDLYLREGGGQWFDVVGWHFYMLSGAEPELMVPHVAQIRAIQQRYGISDKPIWNTESGLLINHGKAVAKMDSIGVLSNVLSPSAAGNYLIRGMTLLAGEGVERFYWFAWDSGSMGLLSSVQPRLPSLTAMAYGTAYRWLVGAKVSPCVRTRDAVWACTLTRNQKVARIVWAEKDTELLIPHGWDVAASETVQGAVKILPSNSLTISSKPILLLPTFAKWQQ